MTTRNHNCFLLLILSESFHRRRLRSGHALAICVRPRIEIAPDGPFEFSAISALEIARLCVEGHLILSIGLSRWIESSTDDLLLQHLPVTCSIAVEAYALPEPFHRDPADRLLVSTARIHQCTLLTANERLLDYKHVETLDCRL
jgi:PIN domain nuclease of toxin-antitoxin system